VRQRIKNFCKHRIELLQDLVVPEAQDAVAARIQQFGARIVKFSHRRMLPAVNLDDELFLQTNKIHDIRRNRILAPELESTEFTGPQTPPKFPLGVGLIFAQ
jgi:hypothetical protein